MLESLEGLPVEDAATGELNRRGQEEHGKARLALHGDLQARASYPLGSKLHTCRVCRVSIFGIAIVVWVPI